MKPPFAAGFRDVEREQEAVRAEVTGTLPVWLDGSLIRNGPGLWRAGNQPIAHWFDGFALLHLFQIGGGEVHYRSRFLRTPDLEESERTGKVARPGFATDPCRSLFKKVASLFVSELGANANINIARVGERYLALTETPMAVEFDPATLATLGLFDYDGDRFGGQITSAHPVQGGDGLYNFTVHMGGRSRYRGYRIAHDVARVEFAHHPVQEPAYLHSCGLSECELILVEGPLVVNPLKLLWRDRPYIHNYRWKPERGTRIVRLPRGGGPATVAEGPPMFVFHQVNAFYEGSDLCVDVLGYRDPSIIEQLTFDHLNSTESVEVPRLHRLRVRGQHFTVETRGARGLELPRIAGSRQGQDYRYVYGIAQNHTTFYDGLTRLDVGTGEMLSWAAPGCFAGEPVFIASPEAKEEDEGVLLSAVLDSTRDQSFLLVLDARNFQELARAYVPAIVPFGFHGGFFRSGKALPTAS